MAGVRGVFSFLVGVVALSVSARADIVPSSPTDVESRQSPGVCAMTGLRTADSTDLLEYPSVTNLNLAAIQFVPAAGDDFELPFQKQRLRNGTNRHNSLGLYLSTAMGLRLWRSSRRTDSRSRGSGLKWHHNGVLYQIGHGIALSPDSLCPMPVCCFVQPVWAEEDPAPQYRLGTIASLWRKSQFTPHALASRGPPEIS